MQAAEVDVIDDPSGEDLHARAGRPARPEGLRPGVEKPAAQFLSPAEGTGLVLVDEGPDDGQDPARVVTHQGQALAGRPVQSAAEVPGPLVEGGLGPAGLRAPPERRDRLIAMSKRVIARSYRRPERCSR